MNSYQDVKYGDPTPPDQSLDFTWEAVTQEDIRCAVCCSNQSYHQFVYYSDI